MMIQRLATAVSVLVAPTKQASRCAHWRTSMVVGGAGGEGRRATGALLHLMSWRAGAKSVANLVFRLIVPPRRLARCLFFACVNVFTFRRPRSVLIQGDAGDIGKHLSGR